MLISGGEVSKAKLFVNNSSGEIGLVGYWDVVAYDELAEYGVKHINALEKRRERNYTYHLKHTRQSMASMAVKT